MIDMPEVVGLCPVHGDEFYAPHGGTCPQPGCDQEMVVYVQQASGAVELVRELGSAWRASRRVVVVPEANLTACALDLAAALDTEPLIREVLELYLAETRWAETAEAPPVLANVPRIRERRAAIERRLAGQPEGED